MQVIVNVNEFINNCLSYMEQTFILFRLLRKQSACFVTGAYSVTSA
jgi:hypothetical protein